MGTDRPRSRCRHDATNGAVADAPTSREEAWRYTPVDEIVARMADRSHRDAPSAMSVSRSVVDALAGSHDGPRLVFVNGFYEAELSDHHDLPAGLWCGLAGPHHPPTARAVAQTENVRTVDGLLAHNRTDGHDVAVVIADDGARFDEPVHIVHVAVPDHREARTSARSRTPHASSMWARAATSPSSRPAAVSTDPR
ncbi:MAG: hypothetical protein WKF58_15915 [Ilumatobacteraceae bacterium]